MLPTYWLLCNPYVNIHVSIAILLILAAAKKFGRSFLRGASFEKKKALVEEFFQVDYIDE